MSLSRRRLCKRSENVVVKLCSERDICFSDVSTQPPTKVAKQQSDEPKRSGMCIYHKTRVYTRAKVFRR